MICFAWSGFPQYAARCIGAFVERTKKECFVVATRPSVPVKGMEELCHCPVRWIERDDVPEVVRLLGKMPECVVVSGWGVRAFNCLCGQVQLAGRPIYAMVDNNYMASFREVLKMVRFRLFIRRKYAGFLVPGNSGVRLLRFYGVPKGKIFKGMYAADSSLFHDGLPLPQREKKLLFVGQLCERKNILQLVRVFLSVPISCRVGWTLEICGCGPLKELIPSNPAVAVHDFVQPEDLAPLYRSARIFCLPSKEEHWGLVVHEAALSGCVLLLSRQVGAAWDFLGEKNGRMFDAYDEAGMKQSLLDCLAFSDRELQLAELESLRLANSASVEGFVEGCLRMMKNRVS